MVKKKYHISCVVNKKDVTLRVQCKEGKVCDFIFEQKEIQQYQNYLIYCQRIGSFVYGRYPKNLRYAFFSALMYDFRAGGGRRDEKE